MHAVRITVLAAAAALALVGSGCASIVHGSGQVVSISSDPSGADVWVDGEKIGKTPVSPNLKRKRSHLVVLRKDGYREEQRVIHRVLSGAVAGNLIAGGLIGWGVDALTGAQWRLVPETLHVELDPLPEGAAAAARRPADEIRSRLAAIREVAEAGGLSSEEAAVLRRTVTAELASGSPPAPGEIPPDRRIVDLWELLQQGLVTPKEYEATKRTVLAGLREEGAVAPE